MYPRRDRDRASNSFPVVDPSLYLFDSTGKQVTPYASAVGRPDPLPLRAGNGPTKAYHKAHGNKTQEEKGRAIMESMKTHIERGDLPADAELVNSSDSEEEDTDSEDEQYDSIDELLRPRGIEIRVSASVISDSGVF